MRFPTKIPTLVALIFIITLIVGISFGFEAVTRQQTRASGSIKPISLAATNISDTSFTFTWMTADPTTGVITLSGAKQKEQTFFDERDTTGKLGKYTSHSVAVKNLTPSSDYLVKIISNGKLYLDNDQPYRVTTAGVINSNPNDLEPAYGTVTTPTNQPAQGALVYLTLEGGQTLSTLVKSSGSWLIPLNLARTEGLDRYLTLSERLTETLLVHYQDQEASAITDTLNDSPVPTMILGKSYDFRKQQAKEPEALAAANTSGSILGKQTTSTLGGVRIVSPAHGAALTTALPLIQGTGIGGKQVTITLGITKPTSSTVIVGADSIWRYTPTKTLSPGKQSVTITTVDSNGKTVALTNVFEILKSGTQVLGEATPSATLSPTATPTATITPFSTPSSTLSGEPLPVSGTTLPTLILIVLGIGLLTGGAFAWIK